MFRITKVFENSETEIYRVEGKITDEAEQTWSSEITSIVQPTHRQIILDFSQVWFMSQKSIQALTNRVNEKLFLLNCGVEIQNRLIAAGFAPHVLS
ncbi:MAG TPA: STAS domain-containing protein [Acidobacteriota bacterium]|nr:STAS domain-containing protein [Acidobacteriota bacterium]